MILIIFFLITPHIGLKNSTGQFPDKKITAESVIRMNFIMSFQNSSEHCAEMFKDVLLNPSCYELNKSAAEFLKIEFKSILDEMTISFNEKSAPFIKMVVRIGQEWLKENEANIITAVDKLTKQPRIIRPT
ncbi:MAG: hypothetical protein KIT56_02145 [Gammaproteobacteria bacterium]|nr:hypothetical protein [Gammaproteobacteria bacterium]MCW5582682.1 hypothetical protein [Gammaproteobacteria bacterium]